MLRPSFVTGTPTSPRTAGKISSTSISTSLITGSLLDQVRGAKEDKLERERALNSTLSNLPPRDGALGSASAPIPSEMAPFTDALNGVQRWVEARNYRGYDPADGLTTPLRALTFGNLFAERVL